MYVFKVIFAEIIATSFVDTEIVQQILLPDLPDANR